MLNQSQLGEVLKTQQEQHKAWKVASKIARSSKEWVILDSLNSGVALTTDQVDRLDTLKPIPSEKRELIYRLLTTDLDERVFNDFGQQLKD